ncbi:MAG: hypothetical protein HRU20_15090 [Pseudomonadales bacterium]|nr:hypothetical protein [Pseudomonadales bacterium]
MYSEEDLDNAVTDGILKKADVMAFRKYIEVGSNTSAVDEEHFRLVQGFNDIFVAIAALLLLTCMVYIFSELGPLVSASALITLSWGLSEYFTRVRRMSLTSILLVLSYIAGCIALPGIILIGDQSRESYAALYIGVFASTMAYLHWRRFAVPITLACILASMGYSLTATIAILWQEQPHVFGAAALLSGLGILAAAVFWDASDRERATRKSDVAFWLHLAASPLIVHGAFSFLDVFNRQAGLENALAVLLVYCVLVLISITLDRRALMVSSLLYVLVVFSKLFEQHGFVDYGFAYTGAIMGTGLLVLSVFWLKARQMIIRLYPQRMQLLLPDSSPNL